MTTQTLVLPYVLEPIPRPSRDGESHSNSSWLSPSSGGVGPDNFARVIVVGPEPGGSHGRSRRVGARAESEAAPLVSALLSIRPAAHLTRGETGDDQTAGSESWVEVLGGV